MRVLSKFMFIFFVFAPFNVHAALQVRDLNVSGDGLITFDTVSQLEWLDLSVTRGRSYNDVSSKLGFGQEFVGWSYATLSQAQNIYSQFGFDISSATLNVGALNTLNSYFGDLYSYIHVSGFSGSIGLTGDLYPAPTNSSFRLSMIACVGCIGGDSLQSFTGNSADNPDSKSPVVGSLLVRTSAVPVPASAWLFGSGLFALVATARRSGKYFLS
jgi:hypothetical protein